MSRKHRLEEERAKQLKQDLAEERDKLKLQKEKIYAALVWRRLPSDIRIQDIKPPNYDEALKLLRDYYYPRSLLTRNVDLCEDETSISSYEKRLLFSMKDQTSVIAVDEIREDKIVGVLINHMIHKNNYASVFARTFPAEGAAYKKLVDLLNYLCRNMDVYEEMECDAYLRMIDMCVHPGYMEYGLEEEFYHTAVDIAKSVHAPVIMGMFSTNVQQKFAKKIGMKVLLEVYYTEYKDKSNKMIICDPGAGNYTCALMAGYTSLPDRIENVGSATTKSTRKIVPVASEEKPKLTRAEKRGLVQQQINKEEFMKKQISGFTK